MAGTTIARSLEHTIFDYDDPLGEIILCGLETTVQGRFVQNFCVPAGRIVHTGLIPDVDANLRFANGSSTRFRSVPDVVVVNTGATGIGGERY